MLYADEIRLVEDLLPPENYVFCQPMEDYYEYFSPCREDLDDVFFEDGRMWSNIYLEEIVSSR